MQSDFLTDIIAPSRMYFDEPMSHHTSFQAGGPAEILLIPEGEEELVRSVEVLREKGIPFEVIGRGTNLLVSDSGVPGVVIVVSGGSIRCAKNGKVHADAGVPLSKLYEETVYRGLVGLEFLSGIPGTLGGAVAMNAGAYGSEIKDVVSSVRVLDLDGRVRDIPAEKMQFAYRSSSAQKDGLVILGATLQLSPGDTEASRRRAAELRQKRKDRQPLDVPSAGSTFKRPKHGYASQLIDMCGLKGARTGGAMVSEKHAGFIVNADRASAQDIYRLIREVRDVVANATGITLEPEVKFLGRFS